MGWALMYRNKTGQLTYTLSCLIKVVRLYVARLNITVNNSINTRYCPNKLSLAGVCSIFYRNVSICLCISYRSSHLTTKDF